MRACLLALGLYRSSGGPSKSVVAFQRALAADVISWVDPRQAAAEAQIWEHERIPHHLVRGSSIPGLRQLCYPQRRGPNEAERLVSQADLVSCHSFWRWHNIWLEQACTRHGVPYWFVPHGGLDPYALEKDRRLKRLFLSLGGRRFLDRAAAVVCATRRESEKLAPLMPSAEPVILPWPLDDADFRSRDEAARRIVRQTLGIPEDSLVMLFFGRLDPMKRPLETISAFAEGSPRSAHLLMVGNESGVSRRQCLEAAQRASVERRVHVVGPAYGAERTAYLDAADIYVSLSHRENFNFTAAEALASGLPVILSPGNDLASELGDVRCGWFLESLDSAAAVMAEAGAGTAAGRIAMGTRGQQWTEVNLRFEVFARRLNGFAARLAKERKAAG